MKELVYRAKHAPPREFVPGELIDDDPKAVELFVVEIDGKEVPLSHGSRDERVRFGARQKISTAGFPVMPEYAFTFHRCQGRTMERLIFDLNKPPRNLGQILFGSTYVAMTRVRTFAGMRHIPYDFQGPKYLTALRPPKGIEQFYSSLRRVEPLFEETVPGTSTTAVEEVPPEPREHHTPLRQTRTESRVFPTSAPRSSAPRRQRSHDARAAEPPTRTAADNGDPLPF
jgi:hypothetical protein